MEVFYYLLHRFSDSGKAVLSPRSSYCMPSVRRSVTFSALGYVFWLLFVMQTVIRALVKYTIFLCGLREGPLIPRRFTVCTSPVIHLAKGPLL